VIDNGIGIAPELQTRVFDLFAQAERTPDRAQGGLGLGLALVRSLVELHGGTVSCHSQGAGTGSTFSVFLPRFDELDPLLADQQDKPPVQQTARTLRLMIVDDNADAGQMLGMYLESDGHHIFVEQDSRSALARARIEAPDACLLDIGMPDMDGNELARRLRAQPETSRSTLIAITGYGQESDRKAALDAGFDHHLVKPVDTAKLAVILSNLAVGPSGA
jgi:CheY-like chemotaxis protein